MSATLESLDRDVKVGGSFTYIIKRGGKLEELEFESEDSIVPEEEIYRSLELYGVGTSTYDVTFTDKGGGQKVTPKLGLLLRIIDENDDQHRGIFITSITYDTAGPKSGFGQIAACILGAPYVGKINNDFWLSILGGRFGATLKLNESGGRTYVNLVHESYKPVKVKPTRSANAKPTKVVEDDDPFSDGEEEDE